MKNELTELRFESANHAVGLDELYQLCGAMSASAQSVVQTLIGPQVRVRLNIVADPQRGSIIIILAPQFDININIAELRTYANPQVADALIEKFSELAAETA